MMLASLAGARVPATPGAAGAACPGCGQPVIPKCGQVNIWHWAHARGADCDPWYEPMTAWHLAWQETVPAARREIVMGNHRADIVTGRGQVVEIQHSHLSVEEIAERERHYGPMIWIFDAIDKEIELDVGQKGSDPAYRMFRWRYARRSIAECERTVFLDLGDELLLVCCIYPGSPVGGWGYLWPRQRVVDCLNEPGPVVTELKDHVAGASA